MRHSRSSSTWFCLNAYFCTPAVLCCCTCCACLHWQQWWTTLRCVCFSSAYLTKSSSPNPPTSQLNLLHSISFPLTGGLLIQPVVYNIGYTYNYVEIIPYIVYTLTINHLFQLNLSLSIFQEKSEKLRFHNVLKLAAVFIQCILWSKPFVGFYFDEILLVGNTISHNFFINIRPYADTKLVGVSPC